MSHSKERKEKICLNCGAELSGRYCHVCGQENMEPRETAWTLVSHFFNDITHFDGKFFSSVKYLITKPGFLSAEYIKGRRARYLHPIRMYVFTSAFFFIIFFSVFNPENRMKERKSSEEDLTTLSQASTELSRKLAITRDPVLKGAIQRSIDHIAAHAVVLEKQIALERQRDTVRLAKNRKLLDSAVTKIKANPMVPQVVAGNINIDSLEGSGAERVTNGMGNTSIIFDYQSRLAYDSVQKELPPAARDGWFKKGMEHKVAMLNAKAGNNKQEAFALLMEKFMHTMPQALFVSLPVFALLLLMLYARRQFFYAEHGIFTIHVYCAIFIILLFYFGIAKIQTLSGQQWLGGLNDVLVLGIYFYLYKAMRRFYGQGRGKTILKFLVLNLLSLFVVAILAVGFFFLSLAQLS